MKEKGKVAIGLSGGVDSSVAAYLLKKQGYQVTGLFMVNWQDPNNHSKCSVSQDLKDAETAAKILGIDFETVDFSSEYKSKVFTPFLLDYQKGLTPNPDILCNRYIKFELFLQHCLNKGFEKMATGHYAKIKMDNGAHLLQANDTSKDQSYFLSHVDADKLRHVMFPLGEMTKNKVRDIAHEINLNTASKKDSTGLCFIGEQPFAPFLNQFLLEKPGHIIDIDTGDILGEHRGIIFFTTGQRKGLQIGGQKKSQKPWYVVKKDVATQTVYVGQGKDHPALFNRSLSCHKVHWINAPKTSQLQAKIRYRQSHQTCRVECINEDILHVHFTHAQRGITPGQYIVFYHNNECLGCAVIDQEVNP